MVDVDLSEDPEYGFAIGRVRALESAFMDRARYERFVRARDAADFVTALSETAYARFLEGQPPDVGRAFDRASDENVAFLCFYAREEWLERLFLLPGRFRRLKTALKTALLRGDTDFAIPEEFADEPACTLVTEMIARATTTFTEGNDPTVVDTAADRLMQELQMRIAAPSRFLLGFLGLHADLENLRTLVRLNGQPGAEEHGGVEMRAAYMPGGKLALDVLVALLGEPWPAAVESLTKAPPYGVGDESFSEYLERGASTDAGMGRRSHIRLERRGREMELRYLRQTRYATFGHEPLVAFFLMSESELRNLRLLYAAKLARLADEETQELVACVD